MTYLAKQPYFKIIREVTSVKQVEVEDERDMYLFSDKITTAHREFPLEDVFDLSYRKVGKEGGILFLHTNHSVYSYPVKASPERFIESCKLQMNNIK